MTPKAFESLLDRATEILTANLRSSALYNGPHEFEQHVLDMLKVAAKDMEIDVAPAFHPHAFPDIVANGFGVEVKYTKQDIEHLMLNAAKRLDGALLEEYWGQDYPIDERIPEWLKRADSHATEWTPSQSLFVG